MIPKEPVYSLTAAIERVKDTVPDQDAEDWLRDAIAADRITWAYVWMEDEDSSYPSLINILPLVAIMEVPDLEIDWSMGSAVVQRRFRGPVECPVVISRRDLDRELANIADSPEPTNHTHSGMAGRPTPKHLYIQEMKRRATDGQLQDSLAQEARDLRDWMKEEHPDLNPGTTGAIENAVRDEYRMLYAESDRSDEAPPDPNLNPIK